MPAYTKIFFLTEGFNRQQLPSSHWITVVWTLNHTPDRSWQSLAEARARPSHVRLISTAFYHLWRRDLVLFSILVTYGSSFTLKSCWLACCNLVPSSTCWSWSLQWIVLHECKKTTAKILTKSFWRNSTFWIYHHFLSFNGQADHSKKVASWLTAHRWRHNRCQKWFLRSRNFSLAAALLWGVWYIRLTSTALSDKPTIEPWNASNNVFVLYKC